MLRSIEENGINRWIVGPSAMDGRPPFLVKVIEILHVFQQIERNGRHDTYR